MVSTKYLTTNIGGYEIIVSSVNGEKLFHRAILNCSYDAALDDGDRIVVSATAEGFDTITGSYNEELSMLSDGIFLSYSSSEPDSLMLTDTDVFHTRIFLTKIRNSISRVFTTNLPEESGNLSSALLLGNRDLLSSSTKRDFSRAGVSHILALSGLHVSIIMGAVLFLLKKLRVDPKVSAILLIICSLAYLFLTGCSVSAARAVIMLDFVYLAMLLKCQADSLTSLSVAGVILMLISPGTVVDVGFWMSFSATLGLLVYMPAFNEYMTYRASSLDQFRYIVKPCLAILKIFATCVFALVPLIAVTCVFTKEISLFSVIGSAVLALPTQLLLILSLLFLPFSSIPFISRLIGGLIDRLSNFMTEFCADASEAEGIMISLNYPFIGIAFAIIMLTLVYSWTCKTKNVFKALAPFALALCLTFTAVSIYRASDSDTIKLTYINASSRCDVTVLTCDGEAVICDVGNGSMASYNKALDEIYDSRATEIETIILTRYSYAHNATLMKVFQSERVHSIWVPSPETEKEYNILVPLKDIAEKYGVEIRVYENGDNLATFEFASITAYRDWIDRSVVPISIVSFHTRKELTTYVSPAFNELELPPETQHLLEKSHYIIFGNKGPLTKCEYSLPENNRVSLIVFADETRAAYFIKEGTVNVTKVLAPEKCSIYTTK